jgi:hypothetical protein
MSAGGYVGDALDLIKNDLIGCSETCVDSNNRPETVIASGVQPMSAANALAVAAQA